MRLSRGGVVNADLSAAFRVGVWVGGIGHHGDGEGDDGVGGGGCEAAGTDAGGVVCHGADVGGCEGDGGGEDEGEEGGWAFHCDGILGVWVWGLSVGFVVW